MTNEGPSLRVTFDTNVCALLHEPERYAQLLPPEQTNRIWQAITYGRLLPFVSEATIFVECLSFPDKLTYLSVAGTADPRPAPDPRSVAMFRALAGHKFMCLHAPLVGAEIFDTNCEWAEDVVHSAQTRHDRFSQMFRNYASVEPLRQLGNELLAEQPPVLPRPPRFSINGVRFEMQQIWAVALVRTWESMNNAAQRTFKRKVSALIGNWCDNLAVASHFGYGNDVFCTFDEGKGSGQGGPLHHLNRANLLQQGVVVRKPLALLAML